MPGGLVGTGAFGGLVGGSLTVRLAGLSVYGNATTSTAAASAITAGSNNTFLGRQSNALAFSALTVLNITDANAGRIPVSDGTTLTTSAELTYASGVLDVAKSSSGGSVIVKSRNTSNTASSLAVFLAEVAGGTANDPVFRSTVSGVTTWTWGIDNSDSDIWKLAPNADVGTSTVLSVTTGGLVSIGSAPAVSGRGLTISRSGADEYVRIATDSAGWDFGVGAFASGDDRFVIGDGATPRIVCLPSAGDIILGAGGGAGASSPCVLATNSGVGFPRIPTCAGSPTGSLTDGALIVNTTNNRLAVRSSSGWYETITRDSSGRINLAGRMEITGASGLASAATLSPTLATYHHVTGTTTIDYISSSGVGNAGGILILQFGDVLTVTHFKGTSGSPIMLQGGVNLTTSAYMRLVLYYDAVDDKWWELARSA